MDPRDTPENDGPLTIIREGDFLPFDTVAETALVGWAMKYKAAIALMQRWVTPADFYNPVARAFMERAFAKYEAAKPVTALTMAMALKNNTDLMEAAGSQDRIDEYLHDLAYASPLTRDDKDLEEQLSSVAKTVADLRVRRWALEGVIDTIERLRIGDDLEDCLAPLVSIADQESRRSDEAQGSEMGYYAADDLIRQLEHDERVGRATCSTGLANLDEVIGGLYQANLVFIGGRPAMGKSIVGTTFAKAGAASGFEVDYFSLEMTKAELVGRMLCDIDYDTAIEQGLRPIQYSRVQMRRISAEERERLVHARNKLAELYPDIEIHDRSELTMSQIAGLARAKAARIKKPQLIVIDHMHLIEPSNVYRGRKVDEISEITKGAKRLAKRLDCPVVLLAQLSRDLERRESKAPQLADFRDSGSIEQDGDVLIGIHRPHYFLARHTEKDPEKEAQRTAELERTANLMEFHVLKNRHGRTETVASFIDIEAAAIRDEKPSLQRSFALGGGSVHQQPLDGLLPENEGYEEMQR
jgi:replicative DNA helicase